jgi:transposase
MPSRRPYSTDLSDEEWEILRPLIPKAKPGGRPRVHQAPEILNAIFYVLRRGCAWRLLPHDFLPWQRRPTTTSGHGARTAPGSRYTPRSAREAASFGGPRVYPSAAIIDFQKTAKTTESGGPRGYDGGKKMSGRKRHLLVDTSGLVLNAVVHRADVTDRDGAKLVLAPGKEDTFPRLSSTCRRMRDTAGRLYESESPSGCVSPWTSCRAQAQGWVWVPKRCGARAPPRGFRGDQAQVGGKAHLRVDQPQSPDEPRL